MTSNQINYWRLEEDKRHNVAQVDEQKRHNIADESIRDIQNQLKAKGLELQSAEDAMKVAELIAKYGDTSWFKVPTDVRAKFEKILGFDSELSYKDEDIVGGIWGALSEGMEKGSTILGNVFKAAAALF